MGRGVGLEGPKKGDTITHGIYVKIILPNRIRTISNLLVCDNFTWCVHDGFGMKSLILSNLQIFYSESSTKNFSKYHIRLLFSQVYVNKLTKTILSMILRPGCLTKSHLIFKCFTEM